MHVAFADPIGITTDDIPADLVAKEKEIAKAQAMQSGKPEAIAEKMVVGKVRKFLEKPAGDRGFVNGGFFVLEPEVFDYIEGDDSIWEREPLEGLASKGQCSIGWFFGLKLHFIINDKGEILDFVLTPGNVDDRHPLLGSNLLAKIYGKLFADKGYISQSLFEKLFIDGIHLITKLRKNMKNSLMLLSDKILLRKRALIESVGDELKNICQIEHTRHRSQEGFIVNLLSGLIAYSYLPKKPSLNLEIIDQSMDLSF
jgi:hypothetical protein